MADYPRRPSANFLVKHTKRETDSMLEGDEALELTAANYGCDEWWLLLESGSSVSRGDVRERPM